MGHLSFLTRRLDGDRYKKGKSREIFNPFIPQLPERKMLPRLGERGVEPLVMKLLAGVIFFGLALTVGVALYTQLGRGISSSTAFQLSAEPSSLRVGIPENGENTATVRISVTRIAGYDKTVFLSATPSLPGVFLQFSPSGGTPDFYSTLEIRVTPSASPSSVTLTLRARGEDGTERTCPLDLKLE
jgi:hypothetical protein